MRNVPVLLGLLIVGLSASLQADKIIMKNGKIYQGHIMGEGNETILISNPPLDPQPRFIEMRDVLTIVHDTHPQPPSSEPDRYFMVEGGLGGSVYSADLITLHPAASLHLEGGVRLHPLVELDADLDWTPAVSGRLAISDGTTLRGYESFYAYNGGFSLRIFPFYALKLGPLEPYAITGFQWNRLLPKASSDFLTGTSLEGGIGALYPIVGNLYLDARFVYQHTVYDKVQFNLQEGTLTSDIHIPTYSILTALSYRFL